MPSIQRTLVVALAAVSLTGCSLFLTRGPHAETVAATPPDCTSSMTWPAVDGLVAGILTVAMISAISQDNNNMTSDDPNSDAIATGFIVAGAAGVSALVGHSRVSKCRRANETYMATTYGQQQPQPYPYGYQQGYGYPQPAPQGGYPQGYPQGYPGQYPQQTYPQPQPYAPQPGYPPQPTTYPAQPPVARPTPPPVTPPVARPQPPTPPVARPQPPAKPPVAKPPVSKPEQPVLGTEGDVCTTQAECASGFSCTGNVCLKAK